jgi:hypothetical protein
MEDEKPVDERSEDSITDEPPPVLGTWPRVYAFVVCYLAVLIALFYVFTTHFAP